MKQLEEGLQRLGFDPGPVDGNYDCANQLAVAKWYKAKGFEPFGPTTEQMASLRLLETAFGDATKNKIAASTAASTAALSVKAARTKAQHAYKMATAEIATKISDRAPDRPRSAGTANSPLGRRRKSGARAVIGPNGRAGGRSRVPGRSGRPKGGRL